MVLQYKSKKSHSWRDYEGKEYLEYAPSHYDFRLLNKARTKTLAKGNYEKVMKRFKQIEYYKNK